MNSRSIPEIRNRLRTLANETGLAELEDLANQMYRRSPVRRAQKRSKKLTPALASEIREYALKHPEAHFHDIASVFDVNPGRVTDSFHM